MSFKEYTIFITCNGGKPYSLLTYTNYFQALQKLYDMISLEKERSRPYYVFNDFYENEYPASLNCKIFCIKERNVTEWVKCSEYSVLGNSSNNVYKFPNIF